MLAKIKFDLLLLVLFFSFSWWLMDKSFGYDSSTHTFRIARHQIGDFGLHLSLIRSFSWGDNFPVESPFFPGRPLPYHYYFDLVVGMLEKLGLRIDIALNILSAISFSFLLFLIYKLPQKIFGENKLLGLISVLLFVFPSSLTFIDFLKGKEFGFSFLKEFWHLPDYINKGPFDNSVISIFFTLNPYLNQRHLIIGIAVILAILYITIPHFLYSKKIDSRSLVLMGVILALTSRIHIIAFLSCLVILFLLGILFKKYKSIFLLFVPTFITFPFHAREILSQNISNSFINPGFLAEKPLTVEGLVSFWFLNLGVAFFLIPTGLLLSNTIQKKLFLSFFSLFIIGNIFQLSFRIEHNHSLFNIFIIFANFYIAFFLVKLWRGRDLAKRVIFVALLFLLTVSGTINLMAVKNDFRYPIALDENNPFIEWIKNETKPDEIFLSREEILDPVTLSGRKNYLGHRYYLEVMGYNFEDRQSLINDFFEAHKKETLATMRKENIKFMVIPRKKVPDFHYKINVPFLKENLLVVYEDKDVLVFKL